MSWIKKIFTKTYSQEDKAFFDFLSQNKIFELLSFSELEKIKPIMYLRTYTEDEAVFFRNDPSQAIYIIKEGVVNFNMQYSGGWEHLFSKKDGQIFGQNGIIEHSVRNYNAIVSSSKASIYVIPQEGLLEIFSKDEELKTKVFTAFMTYYSGYVSDIFSTYRDNLGFFEMSQVYEK